MADIDDTGDVFPSVYQLATTDPGIGGPPNDTTGDGTLNRPLRHLAQRTRWLKTRVDALIAAGTQMASTAVAGLVQLSDSVTSNATDRAATANAVRIANENANARVPASRTVAAGGLATGGGTLDTNRTITVAKASPADAVAGTRDDVALTPLSGKAAIDDRFAQVPAGVSPTRSISTSGLASGGGNLTADLTINVPKATTAQAKAGTLDDRAVTPLGLKATLDDTGLGVGQAWQDVGAQRAVNTAYQNATGRPIMVTLTGSADGQFQVSSEGASWLTAATLSNPAFPVVTLVIPPAHFYRLAGGTKGTWLELR